MKNRTAWALVAVMAVGLLGSGGLWLRYQSQPPGERQRITLFTRDDWQFRRFTFIRLPRPSSPRATGYEITERQGLDALRPADPAACEDYLALGLFLVRLK